MRILLVTRLFRPAAILAAGLLVSACATLKPPAAAPVAATAASAASSPSPSAAASAARPAAGAPATAGQPQPFDTVIKDAKKTEGLFTLWQRDEKVWIELKPDDFGKLFYLAPKVSQGIGESGLFGGTMIGRYGRWGRPQIVEWKRVYNQVQLLARNTDFIAGANTPEGRAVQVGFSPSLVGSAAVASLPHPERKTVLIEANPLFMSDLLGLGMTLQRSYRQGYAMDARNSAFTAVRGKPDAVIFEVSAHFATASISEPPQHGQSGPPSGPVPTSPAVLPDARSMFLGLHYSISKLPDEPMKPRRADPRVGYFTTTVQDFGDDLARTPKQRYVARWRLEKKDPAAALSEPVKPITYWLDRTIPLRYRDAITKGILAWNAAFEKIGFKSAIDVKVQPDNADFDTLDVGVASVRWMTNASSSFGAIGPSQIDPRTGEILDADIGVDSLSARGLRTLRSQVLTARTAIDWPALMQLGSEQKMAQAMARRQGGGPGIEACEQAEHAAEQLGYALDVLEARGELDPDSPEAQQWVLDFLTDITMHEVGHTLGLRHNFRSSRVYTDQQLSDTEFTRNRGLAGSVMEYAPINLSRPGQNGGLPFQLTLGPYDYWAIEYAYKPMPPGTTPEQEAVELQRIAARSAEAELAYGTDEDSSLGIDPETLMFDLGDDPVVFAKKRLDIARDLLKRQESRELKTSADFSVLRRSIGYALRDAGRAVGILARQIGGVRTLRDFPGSGRDPLQPVAASVQREALDLIASRVLAADSFVVAPELHRRLAPDYNERGDALFSGDAPMSTDYSPAGIVLDMQRALLNQLMSDGLANRILDSESKVNRRTDAFQLSELYDRLAGEVWSELRNRADIPGPRRELQRDYVNRLAALLLRPGSLTRSDARSSIRIQAKSLLERIDAATKGAGGRRLSAQAHAHLLDSADTLRQALAARLQRVGA